MHFDWHTEDERAPQWSPQGKSRADHDRKWVWALLALILLALTGYGLWREVEGGVAAAEQNARDSVVGVHNLAERAAAEGDGELLLSLLSGRDPAWTAAQQKRLSQGLLFSQSAPPFGVRPVGDPVVKEVLLNPKLLEATLSAEQAHVVTGTTGITERVTLRQTHIYRKGEQRWLLSPPPEDFWGEEKTVYGAWLTLSYPERDEQIARRLARDINEKIGEMCTTLPGLNCPAGFTINLYLSEEPASFLELKETPSAGRELTLPTPSLVGMPADEKAYQALFRGYATRVTTAAITSTVGYECCERLLFYQAALDWQLYALGLRSRPLTLPHYLAAIDSLAGPAWFQMLWYRETLAERPPSERALALGTVELLLEDGPGGISAATLQRRLLRAAIPNDWLQTVSHYPSLSAFYRALQIHLMAKANELQNFPSPPDQDLALSCYADDAPHLYRYSPDSGQLAEEPVGTDEPSQSFSTPGDDPTPHLVELYFPGQHSQERLALRRPERRYVFRPDVFSQVYSTLNTQRRFMVMQLMAFGPQRAFVPNSSERCDEQCLEGQQYGADPAWSPDGESILWQQDGFVWRSAGDNGRPVGSGSFPFWLDKSTYGYLSGEHVVLAREVDDVPQPLLSVEQLLDVIGSSGKANRRGRLTAIQADPAGSGALVFFLTRGPGQNYLLLLQRPRDRPSWFEQAPRPSDLSVLFETQASIDTPPGSSFSPGGQWFVATTGFSGVGPPGRTIFDLRERDEPRRITFAPGRYRVNYDWSADDNWLAWPRQNYVELVAPASDAVRYFITAPADQPPWQWCESVAWI